MPHPRQAASGSRTQLLSGGPTSCSCPVVSLLVESQLGHSTLGSLPLRLVLFYHQDSPMTHFLLGEARGIPEVVQPLSSALGGARKLDEDPSHTLYSGNQL